MGRRNVDRVPISFYRSTVATLGDMQREGWDSRTSGVPPRPNIDCVGLHGFVCAGRAWPHGVATRLLRKTGGMLIIAEPPTFRRLTRRPPVAMRASRSPQKTAPHRAGTCERATVKRQIRRRASGARKAAR